MGYLDCSKIVAIGVVGDSREFRPIKFCLEVLHSDELYEGHMYV